MKVGTLLVCLTTVLIINPFCFGAVTGSGKIMTETRELDNFSGVMIKGSADVVLHTGNDYFVKIRTDDNVLEVIETVVDGDTLVISSSDSIRKYTVLEVHVTAPEFQSLSIKGSGNISSKDVIETDYPVFEVKGSGDIDLEVQAKSIKANLLGSGDVRLSGETTNYAVSIKGSGDVKCANLAAQNADVQIFGSGNCFVNASQVLAVKVFGSGDVIYSGSPRLEKTIKGSGSVRSA